MAERTVSVRLVAEVGQYVGGMSKASAATMRLGESAGSTGKKSKESFDLAGKGALIMGGAVVAGLGMAISKSMDFEKSMSAVGAATQASTATLGQLRAAAMKAGADTQYSATEAANGITEMAKAGVSAKDIMGGGLTGALSLAAAGQLDVADAAGIASVAMTQFKLSGQALPHVADLLAAGAGKAMGSVEDLGMALNQAGLVASAAGMNIEETTGTLAAFASAGLTGSDAGTSFKTMLQMLQAPTVAAQKTMERLGLSFYDGQGNMLGMADVAGQLHDKLGGLTQEQRNAALATIFGSDAVRAANVLYSQGATGIQDWIDKVNDQGYAQKQAAELTDNLAGDIERLGGSFDTLMINMGSGAQGPLRLVIEMLTGVLNVASGAMDVFASIPGPVMAGVAALAAVAALKGPVSSTFETIALKAMYAGESMGAAGLRGAASGLVGFFGGPWGLAIAGATVGLGLLTSWLGKSGNASADAAGYQQKLADALKQSKGAIDDNVRAMVAQTAADTQVGNSNLLAVARDLGISLPSVTDALLGNKDALNQVTGAANGYIDKALLAENAGDLGMTKNADNARLFMGALGQLAPSMDATVQKNQDVAAATAQAGDALGGAVDPAAQLQTQLEGVATAASDSKKQIDLYKTSLDILNGAHLTAIQAESDFWAAIDAADGALKNMTGSVLTSTGGLNLHSEAGRKTSDVLLGVKDSADQYIATLIEQGATSDEANAKDAELRNSFYQTALQMTGSKKAAEDLTNQIYGIPAERTTTINADTKQATDAIAGTQSQIDNLHGATVKITAEYGSGSLMLPMTSQRVASAYSAGGYTGDGGKYEPAGIVHRGEFVVPKEAVSRIGVSALGRLSGLPGYAGGGLVGGPTITIDGTSLNAAANRAAQSLLASVGPAAGAGVQRWLPVVLQSLAMLGQPSSLAQTVLRRMQQESGGNPQAINNWDINAANGTPSKGLMQVIDPTFRANAMPGYGNIWDPLSNLLASERYAIRRYGSLAAAYNKAGGYADGGYTGEGSKYTPAGIVHAGEFVFPQEAVKRIGVSTLGRMAGLPGYTDGGFVRYGSVSQSEWDRLLSAGWRGHAGDNMEALYAPTPAPVAYRPASVARVYTNNSSATAKGANVTVNARVFIGDREITDIARVEATTVVDGRLNDLYRQTVRT